MAMLNQFKGGDDQVGRAEEVSVDWIHNRIYILTYKLSSTYQEVQYKNFVVIGVQLGGGKGGSSPSEDLVNINLYMIFCIN